MDAGLFEAKGKDGYREAAKTGRTTGKTDPAPQALSASMTTEGLEILVVTDDSVMTSQDGATFAQATT